MTEIKAFKFSTDWIDYKEVGFKGDSNYVIRGYISTDEVDRANEIVTPEAMVDMINQLKSGNIKLDIEHSTFTGETDIPVGKIVDAKMVKEGGKSKIWIEAQLNKSHSKFQEVWKSVKDGFLDAFSIAYRVKNAVSSIVDSIPVKMLTSLDLLNVAITGNPVNKGATMTESFLKSLKVVEEKEMEQEKKDNPIVEDEVKAQPKVEEPKPVEDDKKEETSEEKKPEEETKACGEDKKNPLDLIKSLQDENAELKSLLNELKEAKDTELKSVKETIAELKAELEKPQLKSLLSEAPKVEQVTIKSNPLDLI
jgi:HK97 family phage prohead protease